MLKDTTFVEKICLPSPIVLKYRLIKRRNELLGHPVVSNSTEHDTLAASFAFAKSFQKNKVWYMHSNAIAFL